MTNLFFAWPKKPPALLRAKEPKRLLFVLKRKEAKRSSPARSSWRSVRLSFLRIYRPGNLRGHFGCLRRRGARFPGIWTSPTKKWLAAKSNANEFPQPSVAHSLWLSDPFRVVLVSLGCRLFLTRRKDSYLGVFASFCGQKDEG